MKLNIYLLSMNNLEAFFMFIICKVSENIKIINEMIY